MAQPSKAAPVVLTLFALPFLGGGLLFLFGEIASRHTFKPIDFLIGVAIASFFVLVGGGLIFASIKGYALLEKQAALQEANPTSPWLWRGDWAVRRAESGSQKSYIGAWILAALGNLFLFPFVFGLIPQLPRYTDPRVLIVLGFAAAGIFLTVRAIRATIRHERFGNSYFAFDSLPFSLGQRVSGRIELKFDTQAAHGIDLRLSCVRRVVTGSGKNSTTSNIPIWEARQNVPYGAVAPGPLGRAIPVDFELPAEGFPTDHANSADQVLWLLDAKADVPGVDYTDQFELPVFRTADSPPTPSDPESLPASLDCGAGGRFAGVAIPSIDADAGPVSQPTPSKVVVSMRDGGTEFYFPPFRTPVRALIFFLVSALSSGGVYGMLHSRAPGFFTALVALLDVFVTLGFFHVAFGSARIFASNGEIRWRRGFLGLGARRSTPFSEIASIVVTASLQQGGDLDRSAYSICLQTKTGKRLTLADEISNRQEARWVVGQLETLAGLKLDTHVEVNLPPGVPARPYQVQSNIRTGTSAAPARAMAVFAFFVAVVVFFFVWQSRGLTAGKAGARGSRPATAAPRHAPVTPRVFSGPLGDADVSRILALPVQDQAEELLERAIGHDSRARELFEEHVHSWTGRLQHTDRMNQLLARSQYSKDLRVRSANIDVSLALEGLRKEERTATSLIDRADHDPQYRGWALYYLGMLAGREVAYDRIHPILVGYARNDPDAHVRQWAVEGLRFLGRDEVLDELFASFTEDPAMNVRDRAGCNLSDCGIFSRKQRMRMVPRLIDLTAQSTLSPQMRNWCFLALREITDENQPADALAWNRWYADHGADKLAQFEKLEWWQVRGDE